MSTRPWKPSSGSNRAWTLPLGGRNQQAARSIAPRAARGSPPACPAARRARRRDPASTLYRRRTPGRPARRGAAPRRAPDPDIRATVVVFARDLASRVSAAWCRLPRRSGSSRWSAPRDLRARRSPCAAAADLRSARRGARHAGVPGSRSAVRQPGVEQRQRGDDRLRRRRRPPGRRRTAALAQIGGQQIDLRYRNALDVAKADTLQVPDKAVGVADEHDRQPIGLEVACARLAVHRRARCCARDRDRFCSSSRGIS